MVARVLLDLVHRCEGAVQVLQGWGVPVVGPGEQPACEVQLVLEEVIQGPPKATHDTRVQPAVVLVARLVDHVKVTTYKPWPRRCEANIPQFL